MVVVVVVVKCRRANVLLLAVGSEECTHTFICASESHASFFSSLSC